jgi:hypothetical protein
MPDARRKLRWEAIRIQRSMPGSTLIVEMEGQTMGDAAREAHQEREETGMTGQRAEQANSGPNALRPSPRRGESPSGLHRTASAIRTVVPLIQKLLPLLDGNVASAAANLLAPRLLSQPVVDLSSLETSLMKLRGDLAVIQDRHAQQDVAFKRIDDQMETMKDTVERTAFEQREMAEQVNKIRRNVFVFALLGALLLAVSIGLNAALFFYMRGAFH